MTWIDGGEVTEFYRQSICCLARQGSSGEEQPTKVNDTQRESSEPGTKQWKGGAVTKSQKRERPAGGSCSFSHDRASGKRRDQRQEDNRPLLAPIAHAQTDGKKPSKGSGRRGDSPSGTRGGFRAEIFLWESVRARHVVFGTNYKSESGCTYGETCRFRHVEADGRPNKKLKKSV